MGDEVLRQQFETMTLQYLDSLYNFALLLTRERDRAEDLVQETYLRAYRFYDRYVCGTNYKAWLFTMMRNIFINGVHQRSREVSLSDMDEMESSTDSYEAPADALFTNRSMLEKGIFRVDIEKALNDLPDRLKAVIVLKDIEGFDYKEISKILECPVGTVMSRLWRSRNFLKKTLRDYSQGRSRHRARLETV
ncbi:MAG: sigma-70 family RNA polymerase sigma factor [Nitrospira sp.]|nr:sigma-70 family RNA polymerase sigma factor [Nitrospira sp.]